MSNAINPEHYNRLDPQPKNVIRSWGLNFNLGNAVKYVARAGYKDDIVQDLKKAQEYIQFEIDAIEEEREKATKPVVEKVESAGSGDIYISLGNLAGMKPQSFSEKYLKPKKVSDLVVTAGSKRYYVDKVESDVTDGVRGVFLTMTIKLKDKHSGGSVTIILKG